jgi:ATP-dependent Lon protease
VESESNEKNHPADESFPVLPLRDLVVYPQMVVTLFAGREKSVEVTRFNVL